MDNKVLNANMALQVQNLKYPNYLTDSVHN